MDYEDDVADSGRYPAVSRNRRRPVVLLRPQEAEAVRLGTRSARLQTWQCRNPFCRTWAAGAACETGICTSCGTVYQPGG